MVLIHISTTSADPQQRPAWSLPWTSSIDSSLNTCIHSGTSPRRQTLLWLVPLAVFCVLPRLVKRKPISTRRDWRSIGGLWVLAARVRHSWILPWSRLIRPLVFWWTSWRSPQFQRPINLTRLQCRVLRLHRKRSWPTRRLYMSGKCQDTSIPIFGQSHSSTCQEACHQLHRA